MCVVFARRWAKARLLKCGITCGAQYARARVLRGTAEETQQDGKQWCELAMRAAGDVYGYANENFDDQGGRREGGEKTEDRAD
eukprot:3242256-Pleurochrysis_carterae.AAC.1